MTDEPEISIPYFLTLDQAFGPGAGDGKFLRALRTIFSLAVRKTGIAALLRMPEAPAKPLMANPGAWKQLTSFVHADPRAGSIWSASGVSKWT